MDQESMKRLAAKQLAEDKSLRLEWSTGKRKLYEIHHKDGSVYDATGLQDALNYINNFV